MWRPSQPHGSPLEDRSFWYLKQSFSVLVESPPPLCKGRVQHGLGLLGSLRCPGSPARSCLCKAQPLRRAAHPLLEYTLSLLHRHEAEIHRTIVHVRAHAVGRSQVVSPVVGLK